MQGRRTSSILLAGAVIVGGWAVASPAGAEDARTSAPYQQCRSVKDGDTQLGLGCFDPNGDVFGAHDYVNDGRRVVTSWQTDYGRSGQCHNAKGAFSTHFCSDVNLAEHRKVRIKVSVRTGAKGTDEHSSGWSDWMRIG